MQDLPGIQWNYMYLSKSNTGEGYIYQMMSENKEYFSTYDFLSSG